MTTAPFPIRFTPDDVLKLEDQGLFELVEGRLVEKQMGLVATKTVAEIFFCLMTFAKKTNAGIVVTEQSFRCFPDDPDQMRRPDVAFILAERSAGLGDVGHVPIAPDLVVEVISPNDTFLNDLARVV